MSVLGIHEVIRRIKQGELVTNVGRRELENPEGVGIDLRMGQIYSITGGGAFIEADDTEQLGHRGGAQTTLLGEFEKNQIPKVIDIEPGSYYLVKTIESLDTPLDLMPVIYTRGTLYRSGLLLIASKGDPGYKGELVFGLRNISDFVIKLQLGARIANVVFYTIDGEGVGYRGQHQGGRVAVPKRERQV